MADRNLKARRFGLDQPAAERQAALAKGTATSVAEAALHEFRARYVLERMQSGKAEIDADHYAIAAFASAWDQCVEAIVALSDSAEGGEEIWRLWRDGMVAQGRHVADERMNWETLTSDDQLLDQAISRGMGEFLARLLTR